MGGISKGLTSESLALHFQSSPSRKCVVCGGDKVQSFLDVMDISDLHSSRPLSSTSSLLSASSESNRHPSEIGATSWLIGEKTTHQILSVIQPTLDSESRRKEIIEYLQGLIADTLGVKVFPFGSVPFKTYLPHGDVDLTAVSYYGTSQDLASGICTLLENETKNNANIPVRDVLCVPAQVRVVKCTVHNIAVDISFNQTAGLCALYFLEQVDQFIGKDHLFKLSVILIKAWCYYESRLLGGVHGLISTYALETMILHVINLFHPLLHCPLAVLYKFLEYYSTFDWDKYCVGVNGLVLISSLPKIEVVSLPNCDELLLTEEFLRRSREPLMPETGVFGTCPAFPIKFLNILDPLRNDNNLGRSVSKGSFHRIRSAFLYGACKLSVIMMFPPEKMGTGLENFFVNTLERNGNGKRIDVLASVPPYGSATTNDNNNILAGNYGLWFDDYDMMCHLPCAISATGHLWNNGWGEVVSNPIFQYDFNGYYDMEENLPSSVGSPSGLRRSNGGSNGEKWKPRKTTFSVDNPGTFRRNNGALYEEKWISNKIPSLVDSYYEGPQRNIAAGEEDPKHRGTCAFIPHLAHLIHANLTFEDYDEEPEYRKLEIKEEAEFFYGGEKSSFVNYSMEEFPLLPGSKPIPRSSTPLEAQSLEAQSLDCTEYGTFKPPSPTFSEAGKQSGSDDLVFLDDDKYSPNSEKKMEITVHLADECEFPPLSCPLRPVIPLCKKEFPPLRPCLKSKKNNKGKN